MLVLISTILINYYKNRCPNCKKWQIKGFNRIDGKGIGDMVSVYCPRCKHKWLIKFKKSEFQTKLDSSKND